MNVEKSAQSILRWSPGSTVQRSGANASMSRHTSELAWIKATVFISFTAKLHVHVVLLYQYSIFMCVDVSLRMAIYR
jgi:hypothetical protein